MSLHPRLMWMWPIVLTFSGLSLCLSKHIIREYHFIKILKTWAEAQKYCRENFHDLAAVEDRNENQKLLRTLTEQGLYAWIGLWEDTKRWKWAKDNEDFYEGDDFSKWKVHSPEKKLMNNCVGVTQHGDWQDQACNSQIPALCFNERGPSKFILVNAEQSWFEAQTYCRSKYTDLATVKNQSENDEITKLLPRKAWIGLFKFLWSWWSDQTRVTFENWHETLPTKSPVSCGVVNTTTGTWWNFGCEERHYFICQRCSYPKNTASFRLKFQSEADFHDPNTQQQILKQLQEKLELRGLSNLTLGWSQTDGKVFHKEQEKKKESGC